MHFKKSQTKASALQRTLSFPWPRMLFIFSSVHKEWSPREIVDVGHSQLHLHWIFPLGTCQWAIGKNWHLPPPKSKTTRVLYRLSYQIPVFVCMSVYISVCLIHHMVSAVNFWAHYPEFVEEGEGEFREEELWLGQVFPLGKLGKGVLKQHCFLGRPCCVVEDSEE